MKKFLKKLIAFQSDKNHPDQIQGCFDLVRQDLQKSWLKIKTYSVNSSPCLVAARSLKKHYQYILVGHLDVVVAEPQAFKPVVKGTRLYGRGASDMKGVVVAMIQLVKELKNVDVSLMLTTDEETGGFNGVNYLVNKENYSCDCVIVPDGGNNFQLILAAKGVIHIRLESKGKAVHASRPWLGENAIEKLIQLYQQIKNKIPKTTPKNRWLPTINLGKLIGGDATNKVPLKAEMHLDFRYPKKAQRNQILNLVKEVCKKNKGVSYQVQAEGNLMITSIKNRYIQKICKIAKKLKINLRIIKEHGSSDGRFFSVKGIPVVMFKPFCSQPHIDNEWIDLKSLQEFRQILKKFLVDN